MYTPLGVSPLSSAGSGGRTVACGGGDKAAVPVLSMPGELIVSQLTPCWTARGHGKKQQLERASPRRFRADQIDRAAKNMCGPLHLTFSYGAN